MSRPSYPKTSDPYVRIGTTVLSKKFQLQVKWWIKINRSHEKEMHSFFYCSTRCSLACKKLPDLQNITPKYLYSSTVLIVLSPNLNSKLLLTVLNELSLNCLPN